MAIAITKLSSLIYPLKIEFSPITGRFFVLYKGRYLLMRGEDFNGDIYKIAEAVKNFKFLADEMERHTIVWC